jgi:hypothetical protein
MMLSWIRQLIIRWWAGKDSPREFAFPAALQSARRVLVFMPADLDTFRQSEFFLSRLPQAFPRAKISLLYPPKSLAPRFYNPHGFKVVVPDPKAVWWWGSPRRSFMDSLFEVSFDVVITLNKEPSVFFAAVAITSETAIRIGLPGGMGWPFVTVELRHGREAADTKTEFILFVEMIRRLAAEPIAPADATDGAPQLHTV